jgi:hypothetical protein
MTAPSRRGASREVPRFFRLRKWGLSCPLSEHSWQESPLSCGDVRVGEVITFEEQRFTHDLGECVGEAIPEVQLRRMSTAFAKITVGITRNARLSFRYRFYNHIGLSHEVIEAATCHRISAPIDDDRGFDEIGR